MAGRFTYALPLVVTVGCQLLVDARPAREREDTGERCSDGIDNDENGATDCRELSCSGKGGCPIVLSVSWAQAAGSVGPDEPLALATDPQGNILVTGYFSGRFEWGDRVLETEKGIDAFVAKIEPSGKVAWLGKLGGEDAMGRGITADGDSNVYVVGDGQSALLRPPGSPPHGYDAFVAKFTPMGEMTWLRLLGGQDADEGTAIAVDKTGFIHVAGSYAAAMEPGECVQAPRGPRDAFLIVLTPAGEPVRSTCFGGSHKDAILGVTLGTDDSVFVTGEASDEIDFGDGPRTTHSPPDMFVAKFHPQGQLAWARVAGDHQSDRGRQVVVDGGDGSVVVAGSFNGVVDFSLRSRAFLSSCQATSCPSPTDGFVVKYSQDGDGLWAARFGEDDEDAATSLALGPRGLLFVAGTFRSTTVFAPPATPDDQGRAKSPFPALTTGSGWADMFVAEYDLASGQILGATAFGGPYDDGGDLALGGGAAVGVGAQGAVILAGSFQDSIELRQDEILSNRVTCSVEFDCLPDVLLLSLAL